MASNYYVSRRVGQIIGPFAANTNIVQKIYDKIQNPDFRGLIKILITAPAATSMKINGSLITIGTDGKYILEEVLIKDLQFLTPVTSDVVVDYVY